MKDSEDFDFESILAEYRKAYQEQNSFMCLMLRQQWQDWRGDDNLHQAAFGEP